MKYILMCGGKYENFTDLPKQFTKIKGEPVILRTIRLLQEAGIDKDDIIITSSNPVFEQCGVKVINDPNNKFEHETDTKARVSYWVDAFYHINEPCVYLFGDVYYSPEAISKIIAAETDDVAFFSTAKPFAKNYIKCHVEPMAFKVVNYNRFYEAIEKCKQLCDAGRFWRHPISFDVWCVLKGYPTEYDYFNKQTADIFGPGFVPIYDYSTDVDSAWDAAELEKALEYKVNMENKICVYAICKNESKFVDAWYESMKEADSIVVLDTGSTDDTVEKLRSHGIKVEVKEIKPWRFDVARNESLKLVPDDCNILLCTDLDELLDPGWSKPLREKWIEGKHQRATYKYVWSHLDNGEPGRVFGYNKIHTKDWEWRYPVHELLWHKTRHTENYPAEESLNLFNEITLQHYPDRTKSRGSYLGLLELREQDYPEDMYGLIYLAHEYRYRGFLEKSIEKLNKVLTVYDKVIGPIERASCYLFMGDNYQDLKQYEKAVSSYMKGIEIEPTYRELYLNLGKTFLAMNKYKMAVDIIKEGLEKSYRHYTWLERDLSWSYEPYDLLCLAYFYSGDKLRSLGCAYKALQFEPDNERLKNNVKLVINNMTDKDY